MTVTVIYVPIKAICEEMTAYGFSYKWGSCAPIIQPWRLTEGKARKTGMLFEGERAIRTYWEEHVRPKLPDEFYLRRNLDDVNWVMEARRLCGFDGPDFKDRFAVSKNKKHFNNVPAAAAPATAAVVPPPASLVAAPVPVTAAAPLQESATCNNTSHNTSSSTSSSSNYNKCSKDSKTSSSTKVPSLSSTTTTDSTVSSPSSKPTKRKAEETKSIPDGPPAPASNGASVKRTREKEDRENVPAAASAEGEGRPLKKKTKAAYMDQEGQSELFTLLYTRSSILSNQEIDKATTLIQKGDPKMIGLLLAFKNKEVDDKSQVQYKRVMEALLRRSFPQQR